MARRRGFTSTMVQIQREAERRQRAQAAAQRRAVLDADRARKAWERAQAAELKEQQRLYVESRIADVEVMNEDLQLDVEELDGLLAATLQVDDYLDFEGLKEAVAVPSFNPGIVARPLTPPDPQQYEPPRPSGMSKLRPGAAKRYQQDFENGRQTYEAAVAHFHQAETRRIAALRQAEVAHQAKAARIREHVARQHAEVDAFKQQFTDGSPTAVVKYFALVLEASRYPDGFPQQFRLAYVPESRQLVVAYQFPGFDRVPAVSQYRYVKSGDKITEKLRPARERQELYKSVVAQITVRTLHELFEADRHLVVDTIVFNGHVETINSATGNEENPCLVTVRTTRDTFSGRDFARVDALACLLDLSAGVSKSPAELVPVRPVLEFDMVDPRFVEEADVLGTIDQRPNLMELKPGEFESLITNLFSRMGLETRMTRPSRDGGVDCVAYDNRPVFGGKVVIQAKRYKNTVPVSAVRDLFGSVHNEGASKGILVTTSGYGKAAFDFAKDKPLELLDGTNLLYLLSVHAEVEAKIEPPEQWSDPPTDSGPPEWDDQSTKPPSV